MTGIGREVLIVDTEKEANDVINGMLKLISENGYVTVAQYHTLANKASSLLYDGDGWFDLEGAYIQESVWGYVIKLPPSISLKGNFI